MKKELRYTDTGIDELNALIGLALAAFWVRFNTFPERVLVSAEQRTYNDVPLPSRIVFPKRMVLIDDCIQVTRGTVYMYKEEWEEEDEKQE